MTKPDTEQLTSLRPMIWRGDHLLLLDQRALPRQESWLRLERGEQVAEAIRALVVRGAPAIGITAAYGAVLAARERARGAGDWLRAWREDLQRLRQARPTAVNLDWALRRMEAAAAGAQAPLEALEHCALEIHEADVSANLRLAESGAELLATGSRVYTHCNTGALATGGIGTALGVIRAAWAAGKLAAVYVGETRPWLQGARLTSWELSREGIAHQLVADSAAAWLMHSEGLDWIIVGADRVAANGDVVNKIGTYALAVAAHAHGVGFMVVAPTSTLDRDTAAGSGVPIEQRAPEELLSLGGMRIAAPGSRAWNPVFDVTPAGLVDALVTERGVLRNPAESGIEPLFSH